jgi:hypothetical protein
MERIGGESLGWALLGQRGRYTVYSEAEKQEPLGSHKTVWFAGLS